MKIQNEFRIHKSFSQENGTCLTRDGQQAYVKRNIQNEHVVIINVNSQYVTELICSPDHLVELVLGRLFSDCIISSVNDVEEISINGRGTVAEVTLATALPITVLPTTALPMHSSSLMRSAQHKNNETSESIDTNPYLSNELLHCLKKAEPVTPIVWKQEWIFALADIFSADTPMHRATYGAHSCLFAIAGKLICFREDLGRHNAFDKIIGHALLNNLDLTKGIIFTSGRIPVDMITKAIRAGVPVLASKAVPTSITIELARAFKLALLCSVHSDSLVVFNDPLCCSEGDLEQQAICSAV